MAVIPLLQQCELGALTILKQYLIIGIQRFKDSARGESNVASASQCAEEPKRRKPNSDGQVWANQSAVVRELVSPSCPNLGFVTDIAKSALSVTVINAS